MAWESPDWSCCMMYAYAHYQSYGCGREHTHNATAQRYLFWDNKLTTAQSRYRIDVIDVHVTNNVAHLSALWSATVISPGIGAEVKDGYLSNVMQRQDDGSWKIHIQSWN